MPHVTGNGHQLTATIRPEDIEIAPQGVEGIIRNVNFEGSTTRIRVQIRDREYVVLTTTPRFSPGQTVHLAFPPEKIRILPGER